MDSPCASMSGSIWTLWSDMDQSTWTSLPPAHCHIWIHMKIVDQHGHGWASVLGSSQQAIVKPLKASSQQIPSCSEDALDGLHTVWLSPPGTGDSPQNARKKKSNVDPANAVFQLMKNDCFGCTIFRAAGELWSWSSEQILGTSTSEHLHWRCCELRSKHCVNSTKSWKDFI